jgi:hypothetical protein
MLLAIAILMAAGCKSEPKRLDRASEEKISLASVPPKTSEAFAKDHEGVRLERVNKIVKDNGDVHYEFKYLDKDGRKGEAEFDGAGLKAQP